jgi:hypothetical protein
MKTETSERKKAETAYLRAGYRNTKNAYLFIAGWMERAKRVK